jgi:hypothetical protein
MSCIVSCGKTGASKGYIQDVITVHTNNPDQPEVKLPVYALVEG